MATSMSPYSTRDTVRALEQWGFVEDEQRSSKHRAFRHAGSHQVVQLSWSVSTPVTYRALRKAVRFSGATSIDELMRGPAKVRMPHEQYVLPDLTEILSAAEPEKEHDTVTQNTTPVNPIVKRAEALVGTPSVLVREALSITPEARLSIQDMMDLTGLTNKQIHNAVSRQVALGFIVNDHGYYRLTEAAKAGAPAPNPPSRPSRAIVTDKPHHLGLGRHQRSVISLMEEHANHDWNIQDFKGRTTAGDDLQIARQALRGLRDKGLAVEVRTGIWRLAFSPTQVVKPSQAPVEEPEALDLDAFSPATPPVTEKVTEEADVVDGEIVETKKPMRGDKPRTGKYADRTGCNEDVFDLLQDGVARSTREVCALVDHPYDSVQASLVNLAYTKRISRLERGVYARLDRSQDYEDAQVAGLMTATEAKAAAHVEWTTLETQDDGSIVLRGPDGHLYLARRAKVTFE